MSARDQRAATDVRYSFVSKTLPLRWYLRGRIPSRTKILKRSQQQQHLFEGNPLLEQDRAIGTIHRCREGEVPHLQRQEFREIARHREDRDHRNHSTLAKSSFLKKQSQSIWAWTRRYVALDLFKAMSKQRRPEVSTRLTSLKRTKRSKCLQKKQWSNWALHLRVNLTGLTWITISPSPKKN